MKINKCLTPYNYTNKNDTGRIRYIVVHYVGATGDAEANVRYYASQYVGASAHYYVGFNGSIWQSVEDGDIAWSVGSKSYIHPEARNSNTLNIEMCVKKKNTATMSATDRDWYFEDATVLATAELIREKMREYGIGIDQVIRHYDVTGKICPNPFVYNTGKYTWQDFKQLISGSTAVRIPLKYTILSVTADVLNVRTEPSTAATKAGNLKKNNRLDCDCRQWNGDTCWFHYGDGWVSGRYLQGWVYDASVGKWWYLEAGYRYPVSTWKWIDGKCYYFDRNGWMLSECYVIFGDHYCFLDKNGVWIKERDTKNPDRSQYKVWE